MRILRNNDLFLYTEIRKEISSKKDSIEFLRHVKDSIIYHRSTTIDSLNNVLSAQYDSLMVVAREIDSAKVVLHKLWSERKRDSTRKAKNAKKQ